jgi:Tfp pilus assembly protein PilX
MPDWITFVGLLLLGYAAGYATRARISAVRRRRAEEFRGNRRAEARLRPGEEGTLKPAQPAHNASRSGLM